MTISIRILSDADLEAADVILSSAFHRAESWLPELRLFRCLEPDGVFLACMDENPAGMVATILYSDYAHVGLMGVHRDFQRQGVGIALMQYVLDRMHQQQVPVVRLDASRSGQPLYESLGFVPFDEVYVLQRQKQLREYHVPPGLQIVTAQTLDLLTDSDTEAFGADRSRLLQTLLKTYPGRAFMQRDKQGYVDGYLFVQEKRIGPWVMPGNADPEPLLQAALSLPFPGVVSVVVPAENPGAVALLRKHGFKIVRVNRHMACGASAPAGLRHLIFGQTSLSMG